MVRALGATHVLHCDVGHDLMHGRERLIARLLRARLFLVYPEAGHLLFDRTVPHVPEEGGRVCRVIHMHSIHVIHVSGHCVHRPIRTGQVMVIACRLVEAVVRPAIHIGSGQRQSHLTVHVRRRVVCCWMVVQAREQNVCIGVGVVGGRHEHGGGMVRLHWVGRERVVRREAAGQGWHVWLPAQQEVSSSVTVMMMVRMRRVTHPVAVLREGLVVGLVLSDTDADTDTHYTGGIGGVRGTQFDSLVHMSGGAVHKRIKHFEVRLS